MKNLFRMIVLFALLLTLSNCAPRETWDYVVMGVFIRSEVSAFPSHYAVALETDNNVKVVVHELERGEPHEIHEQLKSNEDLRLAIKEAEVITPIPADGLGEIAYVRRGSRFTASARGEGGVAIPNRSVVTIVRIVGNTYYVKRS